MVFSGFMASTDHFGKVLIGAVSPDLTRRPPLLLKYGALLCAEGNWAFGVALRTPGIGTEPVQQNHTGPTWSDPSVQRI
jgi:hypothetical protein